MAKTLQQVFDGDPVNRPAHYMAGKYECIDVMEALGFDKDTYLGMAFKYLWRAGKKDAMLQDLKKCVFYLNRRIKLMEGGDESGQNL